MWRAGAGGKHAKLSPTMASLRTMIVIASEFHILLRMGCSLNVPRKIMFHDAIGFSLSANSQGKFGCVLHMSLWCLH